MRRLEERAVLQGADMRIVCIRCRQVRMQNSMEEV